MKIESITNASHRKQKIIIFKKAMDIAHFYFFYFHNPQRR